MPAERHMPPPRPAVRNAAEARYLYRLDPVSKLPIVIGKVFVDTDGDAWVRIDSEELAKGVAVSEIHGVALMDHNTFQSLEEE